MTAALRSLDPHVRISAMGGSALERAGADVVQASDGLSVMGFSEVLRILPTVARARRNLVDFMEQEEVDLFVPIDFPGFNSGLAKKAKGRGVPVFWLIAPQVWAWGSWRIPGFRRRIDRLGTLLPFEKHFFSERGFDVFPMGHPLMDDYDTGFPFAAARDRREAHLNDPRHPLVIGIFPGSRRQELDHLLPVLRVTSQAIIGLLPDREVRFVVSSAPGVDPLRLSEAFQTGSEVSQDPLPKLMEVVDLALVCSGTASLEAALAGVPHELVYRTGGLNYFLGKRLVKTPFIGLSNLIMDKPMVREHVQGQAKPLSLAQALLRWLARPAERQEFFDDARNLRQMCGQAGVWDRTAVDILDFLVTRDR